jgi:hypothetical protein
MDHQPFVGLLSSQWEPRQGIIIDDEAGEVYLSRKILTSLVVSMKLPEPDMLSATDDLITRKYLLHTDLRLEGWVVPKSYWEERARAWQSKLRS